MARNNGSDLAWFFAGMALGAAGALLTAPQTGEEARRKLLWQAERGRDRFVEASRTAASRSRDLAADAAESGREAFRKGRDLYQKGCDIADETASEASEQPPTDSPAEA